MSAYYESLRKVTWEDGISVRIDKEEFTYNETIYAEVEKISINDSYENMVNTRRLNKDKIEYLKYEHQYAIRIKNKEDVLNIQEEIAKDPKANKRMKMLVLANAAYRNGLDGELPELAEVSKIKPTLETVLGNIFRDSLVDHTEILHNIYKEKAKNMQKN